MNHSRFISEGKEQEVCTAIRPAGGALDFFPKVSSLLFNQNQSQDLNETNLSLIKQDPDDTIFTVVDDIGDNGLLEQLNLKLLSVVHQETPYKGDDVLQPYFAEMSNLSMIATSKLKKGQKEFL